MASAVRHFEIHADDPERALAFYADVFGWTHMKLPNIESDYWLLNPTGEDPEATAGTGPSIGIGGGLLKRMGDGPKPGGPVNGYVCMIEVEDVDATYAEVQSRSLPIALEITDYEGVGRLFYCHDTEGNIIGVMTPLDES